ncbi:MAG: phosphatase PAP2 family protein [Caldimonas sp.]
MDNAHTTWRRRCRRAAAALAMAVAIPVAQAGGGPLGIDHAVDAGDGRGIWRRGNQLFLQDATALLVVGGALWEGNDSRLGHTLWQSVDSMALGAITSEGLKVAFSRPRPSQNDDPNQWFKGHGHKSFPSGEVMEITTAVTPFILEYGADHPEVWALELLPVYDGIARVRSRAHWQSDVLASFLIGSAIGAYAHSRTTSLSVGILPGGFSVGWKKRF